MNSGYLQRVATVVQTYVVQYSSRLINYGAKGFGLTRKVSYAQKSPYPLG